MADRTIDWVFRATDKTSAAFRSIDARLARLSATATQLGRATKLIGGIAGAASLATLGRKMLQAAEASGKLDESVTKSMSGVQAAFRDVSASIVNSFAPAVLVVAEAAAIKIPQAMAALSFSVVAARQKLVEAAAAIAGLFGKDDLAASLRDQALMIESEIDAAGKALQERLAQTKLSFPDIAAPKVSGGLDAAAKAAAKEALRLEAEIAKVTSGIAKLGDEANRYFLNRAAQISEQFRDPLDVLKEQIVEVNQLFSQGLIDTGTADRAIAEYADSYKRSMGSIKETNADVQDSTTALLGEIRSAAEGFGRELTDVFFDATNSIGDMFKNLAETIAKALFTKTVTQPLIDGILGSFSVGARASGGPVAGGSPYIVGERGPELFVPGSSGKIVPNGEFGGAAHVSLNMTINSVDPQTAAATIVAQERLITGMVRRSFTRAGIRPQMA